jgi:UDP-N-acetylglucosamine transferase subunit ALG13
MILVTVGTHDQQFDRLVIGADELAGMVNEKVIIQRGCSNYLPHYSEHYQWVTGQKFDSLIDEARIVITQASAGTIIQSLQRGKPLVVVPRLMKYHENHNDHQTQLAGALGIQYIVVVVDDPNARNLMIAIKKAEQHYVSIKKSDELVLALRRLLDEWSDADSG